MVGKIAKHLSTKSLYYEPSTSCKNFLNFSAVNPRDVVSLQK